MTRYLALATDYDGTLARQGAVDAPTIAALERFRAGGRTLILVTGRVLDELKSVCPRLDLFAIVVAENGAILYHPADGSVTLLAQRPPDSFVESLRDHGVSSLSVGRVILATWGPHLPAVRDAIAQSGLDLRVILNKSAVMILPSGVNKGTGLTAALDRLGIAPEQVVAVGDAENDGDFLALCGYSAAVANALPALKDRADLVTKRDHGAGVRELIADLLADCLGPPSRCVGEVAR